LAIFFITGVTTLFVGKPFYSPDTHIVGASIAVSALVGAAVVISPNKNSPLLLYAPLGLVAVIYLIFNAFMLSLDQSGGIAYQSHIIGFFVGVIFGLGWRKGRIPAVRARAGTSIEFRYDFQPQKRFESLPAHCLSRPESSFIHQNTLPLGGALFPSTLGVSIQCAIKIEPNHPGQEVR
jgi:Rhomboid family